MQNFPPLIQPLQVLLLLYVQQWKISCAVMIIIQWVVPAKQSYGINFNLFNA